MALCIDHLDRFASTGEDAVRLHEGSGRTGCWRLWVRDALVSGGPGQASVKGIRARILSPRHTHAARHTRDTNGKVCVSCIVRTSTPPFRSQPAVSTQTRTAGPAFASPMARGQSWWISIGERRGVVERRASGGGKLASFAALLEHLIRRGLGPLLRDPHALGPQESVEWRLAT